MNGFTGSLVVSCSPPAVLPTVKIPTCGGGPIALYNLTPDRVINGTIELFPYGAPIPVAVSPVKNPFLACLLTLALLAGLTLRRRSARRLTLPLVLAALIPLSPMLGCGSSPRGFTPGTYTYVVSASQYPSTTPLERGVNATVTIQ